MMKEKILSRILTLCMTVTFLLALVPCVNAAYVVASGTCGEGEDGATLTWSLNSDGILTISGSGAVPNYSSLSKVPWYNYATSILRIVLGEGVTSISNYAIAACENLMAFTVDDGSQYFRTDESGVLYNKDRNELIRYPEGKKETSYTIPECVTEIGANAFHACKSLIQVVIPGSVRIIGDSAFSYCKNLVNVVIPDSVTNIESYAFTECESLSCMVIPASVTNIGNNSFIGCDSMTSISVDAGNQNYASDMYGVLYNKDRTELIRYPEGKEETGYTIPEGVTKIEADAFYGCSDLTSVVIPDTVTSIGSWAFAFCGLTNVSIPSSVTSIANHVFYYCSSLSSVIIPSSVTSIGMQSFYRCTSLTEIVIPRGVKSIESSAFQDCYTLTSAVIPNSVMTIEKKAFYGCGAIVNITIPACISSIKDFFPNCYSTLTSAVIADGVTYIRDNLFNGCGSLANVVIPSSVTTIGSHAFEFCSSLTDVEIPNSITRISNYAFYGCDSLTSMMIPSSVTNIGEHAFHSCGNLQRFIVDPDSQYYSTDTDGSLYNKDQTILIQSVSGHSDMGNFSRSRTYDGRFWDVTQDAWYYESVVTAYELGLMEGVSSDRFDPNGFITVAQAITLVSRLCDIYEDGSYVFQGGDPWYQPYVDYARKKGLIDKARFYENYPYTAIADRGDIAGVFGALPGGMLSVVNQVSTGAIPDVDPHKWYAPSVYLLYQAGIIEGKDSQGAFDPNGSIKRCEMAAIVSRIADQSLRKRYALTPEIVTVYADDGEARQIPSNKLSEYLSLGWQREPFTLSRDASPETLLNSATLDPMKTNYDELDEIIDRIFSAIITEDMTTYEKTKACYGYLIDNAEYDHGFREYFHPSFDVHYIWQNYKSENEYFEGDVFLPMKKQKDQLCAMEALYLLKSGRGDCQCYAYAFLVMTRRIGLKSYICEGIAPRADGSGEYRHVWNTISIGGMDFAFDAEVEDKIAGGGSPTSARFCRKFEVLTSYHDYDIEEGKSFFGGFEVFRFD